MSQATITGNRPESIVSKDIAPKVIAPKESTLRLYQEPLGRRFEVFPDSALNIAYRKITLFAQEIAENGHTEASKMRLRDLVQDFKFASEVFVDKFNDIEKRQKMFGSEEVIRKIHGQFNDMKQHVKDLSGDLKDKFKSDPEPDKRRLPSDSDLKKFDARRFFNHVSAALWKKPIFAEVAFALSDRKNKINDAKAVLESAEAKRENLILAEQKKARIFQRHKKIDALSKQVHECETAVNDARKEYRKTWFDKAKNVYKQFYGMKVIASKETAGEAYQFLRPLSSEDKDLRFEALSRNIERLAPIKRNGLPPRVEVADKNVNDGSFSIRRREPNGDTSNITIYRTSHPGRSCILIDGNRMTGWNDKIEMLARRFIAGKELKYKVRPAADKAKVCEELVFKPVHSKLMAFCSRFRQVAA